MVCQATAQRNYERAVTLVNAMVHAPFEVSEKQWTDLFVTEADGISRDNLKKLLNALHNYEVAREEATVSNLSRALHSLCGSRTSKEQNSVAFEDKAMVKIPVNGSSGELDDKKKVIFRKFSAESKGPNLNPHENPPAENSNGTCHTFSVGLTHSDEGDDDTLRETISRSSNYACTGDKMASNEPSLSSDDLFSTCTLDGDSEDIDNIKLKIPAREDDSHGSDLPSANEILETWKESSKRDGIFFPFQLGQKLTEWHHR